LSTLLSEQLPTQGTSVHREMGAGTLVEALANGGASSNANMAHPRRPGCTQKLSARAVGGVKAGYLAGRYPEGRRDEGRRVDERRDEGRRVEGRRVEGRLR
jgi:hypothetical protein